MEDKDLIAKIQKLKVIKPRQDWIFQTKNEIFQEERGLEKARVFSIFEIFPRFFYQPALTFLKRPAFYFSILILIAGFLAGFFVIKNSLIENKIAKTLENQQTQQLLASLAQVKANLDRINQNLDNLKKAKEPAKVLVMTETIKAAAKNVQDSLNQIEPKKEGEKNQVLASLNQIKEISQGLIEESERLKIEMLKTLLEDLEKRTLTGENKERLQLAKNYYNEGKYIEAMVLVERIYNQ